jgi:hypothetical protein
MSESPYSNVERIVWREHPKGPGIATFEYTDGGHDHRQMSQYEARNLAQSLGLVDLQEKSEIHEWVRI